MLHPVSHISLGVLPPVGGSEPSPVDATLLPSCVALGARRGGGRPRSIARCGDRFREHGGLRGLSHLGRPRCPGGLRPMESGACCALPPSGLGSGPSRPEGPAPGPARDVREPRGGHAPAPRPSSTPEPVAGELAHPPSCGLLERGMAVRGGSGEHAPGPALGTGDGARGGVAPGRTSRGEDPQVRSSGVRAFPPEPHARSALVLTDRLRQPGPRRAALPEAGARGPGEVGVPTPTGRHGPARVLFERVIGPEPARNRGSSWTAGRS